MLYITASRVEWRNFVIINNVLEIFFSRDIMEDAFLSSREEYETLRDIFFFYINVTQE